MRLTQINLAGFKSFVDPTRIPVPGQLVGVVGPNGCGKSNVIDAVRWVLGETSARHLRGETMQDVLFNGSGDRKPVNRASVELIFDNSLGKAAGQWSQYAEISIKRVLQRDGDSSYYINNVHVRRRDIADIFLGTGLGSRAYAIIEQGMISRVIEAKPEELRIFLEEAAGVSKYRERRRETELRLKDTRENLLRVDDIRQELAKQIEHLQAQAEVARQYHALNADLQKTQGLLWFTRKQEAGASRNRYAREIERLEVELEAETAKLREAEKRLEEIRAQHYRASDEMHAAQGALYEANAEVARLEQQIAHVRDSRTRIEHQLSTLGAQLVQSETQHASAQGSLDEWRREKTRAEEQLAACAARVAQESEKLPVAEETYRATNNRRDELQRGLAAVEQALKVEQTKLAHAERLIDQLAQREERLREEQAALEVPDSAVLETLQQSMQRVEQTLQSRRELLAEKERTLPESEARLQERNDALDAATQNITATEARLQALQQLQDRLARGAEMAGWLAARELDRAPRLWQGIEIEPGWEDALEAVLRERLNGITLDQIEKSATWLGDGPPGKITVVGTGEDAAVAPHNAPYGCEPLLRYVTCRDSRLRAVLSEWLYEVYVVTDAGDGMRLRESLSPGALLVSREGHVFTRHSVSFHAPDSELHGVLSRQREIDARKAELGALREEIEAAQAEHHTMQMEALKLSEQAQRLTQRGEQIAGELGEIAEQAEAEGAERANGSANVERLSGEAADLRSQLDLATDLYRRAETVLDLQRSALQEAQHQQQEASFKLRSSDSKINEIGNTINVLSGNMASLDQGISGLRSELASCDEGPWQTQLQQALAGRGERAQALAQARDALEGMESQLREIEQMRLDCEQKLDPLRTRIGEVRLKEQEARLTEEQFAQQLAEAGADEEVLRGLLEKGTRSGALQGEINRLSGEIQALGAVNLAALEELQAAQERQNYLAAQSRDLSEAMATL
ncbi:MAG TPA: chromosome segregation protein SMC, partial [Burkholderiales bacterium]|nr:chromosome segregation protein SMC [Burkholderiales bacterium]